MSVNNFDTISSMSQLGMETWLSAVLSCTCGCGGGFNRVAAEMYTGSSVRSRQATVDLSGEDMCSDEQLSSARSALNTSMLAAICT